MSRRALIPVDRVRHKVTLPDANGPGFQRQSQALLTRRQRFVVARSAASARATSKADQIWSAAERATLISRSVHVCGSLPGKEQSTHPFALTPQGNNQHRAHADRAINLLPIK